MRSLRARLIAWYVSVGAFIVLFIGVLAAIAMIESVSFRARQAMAAAAQDLPQAIAQYRAKHADMRSIDPFLHQRFRSFGVIVHARAAPPHMLAVWPGPPPGNVRYQRFGPGPPPDVSMYERLLAIQIKPITASFPSGQAVIFVDPRVLRGLFGKLGLFVLVLAIVVLTAAWRIAVVVAENTLEPLLRTTQALDRFGSGQFTPVDVRPEDRSELGELARAYNRAVGQITRALDERASAEAEMRQFVADAGHQLRTPLTVIMGYVSGMAQRAQSAQEGRRYDAMLVQARRMKDLIDRLITLARLEHAPNATAHSVDLRHVALQVRAAFSEAEQVRITVVSEPSQHFADAGEIDLTEALSALVDNALKYAVQGHVEIAIGDEGDFRTITVADRGPGMTPDDLENAFDRFYRGSASEDTAGTGLGLAIVRKSIERAGGQVRIGNREGGGLIVTLLLKSSQEQHVTLSA